VHVSHRESMCVRRAFGSLHEGTVETFDSIDSERTTRIDQDTATISPRCGGPVARDSTPSRFMELVWEQDMAAAWQFNARLF
jgi:hypothetical protein